MAADRSGWACIRTRPRSRSSRICSMISALVVSVGITRPVSSLAYASQTARPHEAHSGGLPFALDGPEHAGGLSAVPPQGLGEGAGIDTMGLHQPCLRDAGSVGGGVDVPVQGDRPPILRLPAHAAAVHALAQVVRLDTIQPAGDHARQVADHAEVIGREPGATVVLADGAALDRRAGDAGARARHHAASLSSAAACASAHSAMR